MVTVNIRSADVRLATIIYQFNGQKYILSSCESNVDEVCSELTEQTS
jgi:hypothetical protein